MKKLGKLKKGNSNTIEYYYCSCGGCGCACACSCSPAVCVVACGNVDYGALYERQNSITVIQDLYNNEISVDSGLEVVAADNITFG